MKLFKNLLITLVLFFSVIIGADAQSGWNEGYYYAYQGGSDVSCGSVYTITNGNGFTWWTEGWQSCQQREWYQEYKSGYIYLWNSSTGQWYTEWREGYFWYFTWYNYSKRVW